jgi:phosphate transport system protein
MTRDSLLSREISKLNDRLLLIGGAVERSLTEAVRAVEERDAALADRIIAGDSEIDRLEVDLEEECLKVLALHQPVATDLRFIITVLKVNNDLERVGDLAGNMAEYAKMLSAERELPFAYDFPGMAARVQEMLTASLDALVRRSSDVAHRVRMSDDEIDDLHRDMYGRCERKMREQPELLGTYVKHIGLSRCLERIADYATNIAEDVIYLITGEIVRH